MPNSIRFILALHNHQPIGNFEHVIEQAYYDSYLPFLDVFQEFEPLKIALHTSGSLMEWLDAAHPDYVDRLADLAAQGRVEIMGGAFFEPILAMLPSRDRIGQIRAYSDWLHARLGADIRGMWMPERVWEQAVTRDVAAAGIEYTILDDFHFKCAGLVDEDLRRYYITEDDGRVLAVFPGSETLRYLIPFAEPQQTIDYLASIAEVESDAVILFGDDGEKFGTWPDTKQHVYEEGWLRRFFELLCDHADWIHTTTPSEALGHVDPQGKVYLPDASYREMTEWALPAESQLRFEDTRHALEEAGHWEQVSPFVRGGIWRNFKAHYEETDEMYARMLGVSRRLAKATESGWSGDLIERAKMALYRGQCNCGYWHGAFGGVYLPHLRNAVYHQLITAENLLNEAAHRGEAWVEAKSDDFNFDSHREIQLANERMAAWIAPARGGRMYGLDVRSIQHNLLATLTRRPEAYHRKVLAGAVDADNDCASIHDRVVFKQENLDQRVGYDTHLRKSLIDFFFDLDVPVASVAAGEAMQYGDFFDAAYQAVIRRNPDRMQVVLSREGLVWDTPIQVTKAVTLSAASPMLEIAYRLENLPQERVFHFATELNFAGMPSGADDRYFSLPSGDRLGHLGTVLDIGDQTGLVLTDQWLGLDVRLIASRPTSLWTFPVETVSQSEGGFELVHQSVAVLPHWHVAGDEDGVWSVVMHLELDTSRVESRKGHDTFSGAVA